MAYAYSDIDFILKHYGKDRKPRIFKISGRWLMVRYDKTVRNLRLMEIIIFKYFGSYPYDMFNEGDKHNE